MTDLVTWLRGILDEDERITASEPDDWRTRGTYTDHFAAEWVLADIAAKRAILDAYVRTEDILDGDNHPGLWWIGRADTLGEIVRLVASAYAGRPGYREEWAPDKD